ncbi:hypothetical protein CIK05_11695 [Bdellovibrio sp. qaytius]|nr:hypothetical protein CIK05_11695 [Bdellovibrio sp. qaytius]
MNVKQRRAIAISVLTLTLVAYQNCSQNGTIETVKASKVTATSADQVLPSPADVPAAPAEIKYQNHSKVISASESTNKVDVLVVIDNSVSMTYEQLNMAQRFGSFLSQLQGLDWQVGIVTTDVTANTAATTDGKLLSYSSNKRLISSQDDLESAKSLFASTIQRTETGASQEQGIKASYRALERAAISSDPNSALIRQNAALSVIVITDADETGSGTQNNPDNLHNYITTKYPGKSFKFHSIIVKNGDTACRSDRSTGVKPSGSTFQNTNETYGAIYTKLSEMTSGIIGSVCQPDYGNQLQLIGQSTSEQVKQATLDCAPVDRDQNGFADIEIRNVQTNSLITNYVVSGLQISFDQPLAIGSYSINYTCIAK